MANSASPTMRTCIKTGCRWPAAATLSYRHSSREVWLLDLSESAQPSEYDLCPHHADHFVVPVGWTLLDDRNPIAYRREPSASEIVERANAARIRAQAAQRKHQARPARVNRYAELLAQLDELAQSTAVATLEADEDWREYGWSDNDEISAHVTPVLQAVERANQLAASTMAFDDDLLVEDTGDDGVDRGDMAVGPAVAHPASGLDAHETSAPAMAVHEDTEASEGMGMQARGTAPFTVDRETYSERELIELRLHELLDRLGAKPRPQAPANTAVDTPQESTTFHAQPVRTPLASTGGEGGLAPVVPLFSADRGPSPRVRDLEPTLGDDDPAGA